MHLLLLLREELGRGRGRGWGRGRGGAIRSPCCSGLSNKERNLFRQLLLHACHLLPLAIEMQLHLRGLRVAARQLQPQATVFSFQDGGSSIELCLHHAEMRLVLRICSARASLAFDQLHLHLLQLFSQDASLFHPLKSGSLPFLRPPPPVPLSLRRNSCATTRPLTLRPLLLMLPLLLRAPLPRLLLDVCQWPRMLHACELVLLVVAMGGRRRLKAFCGRGQRRVCSCRIQQAQDSSCIKRWLIAPQRQ